MRTETSGLRAVAVGVRGLLEVGVLVAVGYWGFTTTEGLWRIGLGVGAPLAVAGVWAVFGSPTAPIPLDEPWRLLLSLALYGLAVGALAAASRPLLGAVFGIVALADTATLYLYDWA